MPRTKMTTVSRFSRQNDAGLSALTVILWENLAFVVVLVLENENVYNDSILFMLYNMGEVSYN